MPRPRSVPDRDLLDSALAILHRDGPAGLTFAALASETGLAPATLVQRFGPKPALIQAALLHAWDLLDAKTAECDEAAPPTPAGAVGMLAALSEIDGNHDFTDGLMALREDFRDPVLRRRGVRWRNALAKALGRRLADETGPRPDFGRLMAAQWQGAIIWWGFAQDQPIRDAVSASLTSFCQAIGKMDEPNA